MELNREGLPEFDDLSIVNRRSNDQSVRDILKSVFKDYRLEDKLVEVQLRQRWPEIMGPAVARYTDEITLQRGVLRLRFSSAPMREQFRLSADQLRQTINDAMGEPIVSKVNVQ